MQSKDTTSTRTFSLEHGTIEFINEDNKLFVHMESNNSDPHRPNVTLDSTTALDRDDIVKLWGADTLKELHFSEEDIAPYPTALVTAAIAHHKIQNPWTYFTIRKNNDANDNEEFVGQAEVINIGGGDANLGYGIKKSERGKHYATTSAGMMLSYSDVVVEHGFSDDKKIERVKSVLAQVSVTDLASMKIVKNIGMQEDGGPEVDPYFKVLMQKFRSPIPTKTTPGPAR